MSKPSSQDRTKICIALDFKDEKNTEKFLDSLSDKKVVLKVGLELFTVTGPDFVRKLKRLGFEIFLDLKLHDIPNTVSHASSVIAELGVQYFTLHLAGGRKMIEMTREGLEKFGAERPKILGVSVLTSFSEEDWREVGVRSIADSVKGFVELGVKSGVDGVVCSPLELAQVKSAHPNLLAVTPGIRPAGSDSNDQARVMTPAQASKAGAGMLVIGRPITQSKDPNSVIRAIKQELSQ